MSIIAHRAVPVMPFFCFSGMCFEQERFTRGDKCQRNVFVNIIPGLFRPWTLSPSQNQWRAPCLLFSCLANRVRSFLASCRGRWLTSSAYIRICNYAVNGMGIECTFANKQMFHTVEQYILTDLITAVQLIALTWAQSGVCSCEMFALAMGLAVLWLAHEMGLLRNFRNRWTLRILPWAIAVCKRKKSGKK